MKKKTLQSLTISQVVVALLIGFIAMPVAMTALIRSQDDDGILVERQSWDDQHARALNDRLTRRLHEREYWDAVQVHKELTQNGVTGLRHPDINDVSFDHFFDAEYIQSLQDGLHGSAPDSEEGVFEDVPAVVDVLAEYKALQEWNRDLMDGYRTIRFCPNSPILEYRSTGFKDLCDRLLEFDAMQREQLLFDRSARLKGFVLGRTSQYQSLKHRLEVLRDSLEGTGLTNRPRTYEGGRPSLRELKSSTSPLNNDE